MIPQQGNILIDDQNRAVLADFGRSKKIENRGYTTNLFVGAARYMAPEFFPGFNSEGVEPENFNSKYTMASDIYSFAMICFEVCKAIYIYILPLVESKY